MLRSPSLFGLLALIGVVTVAFSAPASAEFFSCNQRPGQLLYSYNGTPAQFTGRRHSYSAPRYSSRSYHSHRSYRSYYRAGSTRYRRHATYYGDTRYWNGR